MVPLLSRHCSNTSWSGCARFCAVGAAVLVARFLPHLGELVAKLSDLLLLGGTEIAHALLAVGSLTFGVRPSGRRRVRRSRSTGAHGASWLPPG